MPNSQQNSKQNRHTKHIQSAVPPNLHNSHFVIFVTIRRIYALYAKFPTKFKAKSPHKAHTKRRSAKSSQFTLRYIRDNQAHLRFVCQIPNKIQSKIATQSIYKAQVCQIFTIYTSLYS